jgi:hypothetical protein
MKKRLIMNIQDMLLSSLRNDLKYEKFRDFCNKETNYGSLKELFSDPSIKQQLNIKILSIGLLGALENNQKENISIIGTYVLNNNVLFDIPLNNDKNPPFDSFSRSNIEKANIEGLNIIFNAAINFKQVKLAKLLSKKYSILDKSITDEMDEIITLKNRPHAEWAKLKEDGTLGFTSIRSGPVSKQKIEIDEYSLNPILFNLKNFNSKLLDDFLSGEEQLNTSVVKHGLIMNMFLDNNEAVLYLFSNKKCAEIIENSDVIKTFINSDKEWVEKKQLARSALVMSTLNNELSNNNKKLSKIKI